MNWITFLSWTTSLYLVYYLSLILYDYSCNKSLAPTDSGELTFTEDIAPKKAGLVPEVTESPPATPAKPGPAIIGSGGVSLKNLFGLCREEAIIYTRPVSF